MAKLAVEHIRRMRGGAQAHLLRCDDDSYYVVKFQNNPQHTRVLANEFLGTRLAVRLGLATPEVAVVEVREELIRFTAELCVRIGMNQVPCTAGFQFGSRYPGDPAQVAVHDFLPDERLADVANLADFAGALVFDKWTCNTNGRQAIFFQPDPERSRRAGAEPGRSGYEAQFVDQGFCFNAAEWSFPDAPLRGLYVRHRVYKTVRGMDSFATWLARLERIDENVLDETAAEIPPEWLGGDHDDLFRLLEQLLRRRKRVPDLILETKNSYRQPFENWR